MNSTRVINPLARAPHGMYLNPEHPMTEAEQADVNDRVLAMKKLDLEAIIRILAIPERGSADKRTRVYHRIQTLVPDSIRHIVYTRKWDDLTLAEQDALGMDVAEFGTTNDAVCARHMISPKAIEAAMRGSKPKLDVLKYAARFAKLICCSSK